MERRIRLAALSACLVLTVWLAVHGLGGTAPTVMLVVSPVLGVAALIAYGVLLSRYGGKEPINVVRALEPAERRQVRTARRRPASVPLYLTEIARDYAEGRARSDGLLGWLVVAVALCSTDAVTEPTQEFAVRLALGATLVLAGFLADDIALSWHRTAVALAKLPAQPTTPPLRHPTTPRDRADLGTRNCRTPPQS